ncbi:MAG TPA: phosphotransferase, partial [Dehalococcoidia bacterium]|nr:phosphotransferase [Dehalococcoidia bacterium]
MLKADLHVHSNYSYDCRNKAEDIIRRCGDTGINCIAVADHGTAEGALKIQQ